VQPKMVPSSKQSSMGVTPEVISMAEPQGERYIPSCSEV